MLPGLQSDTAQVIPQPELLERDDRLRRQGSGVSAMRLSSMLCTAASGMNRDLVMNSIAQQSPTLGPVRSTCMSVDTCGTWPLRSSSISARCAGSTQPLHYLLHPTRLKASMHPPSNLPCNAHNLSALCIACMQI